jgi:hypothetical protein
VTQRLAWIFLSIHGLVAVVVASALMQVAWVFSPLLIPLAIAFFTLATLPEHSITDSHMIAWWEVIVVQPNAARGFQS